MHTKAQICAGLWQGSVCIPIQSLGRKRFCLLDAFMHGKLREGMVSLHGKVSEFPLEYQVKHAVRTRTVGQGKM